MTAVTAELRRYAVKLKGFAYTGHKGPDGQVHLKPVHRPNYDTAPTSLEWFEVEAADAEHAKGVFNVAMGIKNTTQPHSVRALSEGEEPPVTVEAKALADEVAALKQANADLVKRLEALEGGKADPKAKASGKNPLAK